MNIKLGDSGWRIKYLQTFLKENYSNSVCVTGVYDKYTHNALINYLHSPDVISISDMRTLLDNSIEDLSKYFIVYETVDGLLYKAKSSMQFIVDYLSSIYKQIVDIAENNGWTVSNFVLYKSNDYDNIYQFSLKKKNIKNCIPKKDLLKYVNINTDDYLTSVLIDYNETNFGGIDTYGRHFEINPSSKCKVMSASDINRGNHYNVKNKDIISDIRLLMIPCQPNTTYTIVCNNTLLTEYYNNFLASSIISDEITNKYGVFGKNLYTVIATTDKAKENIMYADVDNAVIWECNVRPFDFTFTYLDVLSSEKSNTGFYVQPYITNKQMLHSITYTTNDTAKYLLISYICSSQKTIDINSVELNYQNNVCFNDNSNIYKIILECNGVDGEPPYSVNYKLKTNGVNDFFVFEGDLLTDDVYAYYNRNCADGLKTYYNNTEYNKNNTDYWNVCYADYMNYMKTGNQVATTAFTSGIVCIGKKLSDIVSVSDNYLISDYLLNYIDGSVICEYSDPEDIIYLKSLLVQLNTDLKNETDGVYTENIKNYVYSLQVSKYKDLTKEDRKSYVKNLLENMYSSDSSDILHSEPNYIYYNKYRKQGKYTFDNLTNKQIYYSLYLNDNHDLIFQYSPTVKIRATNNLDYYNNTVDNPIELAVILNELLENYPIDEEKIVKYNVSMPTGYVDSETMQIIQNKIKEV